MIHRRALTEAEATHAMRHGEFAAELLLSAPNIAVVLSQDWCGQWAGMKRYLQQLADSPRPGDPEVWALELEYNRVAYFHEFLRHKEEVWGNDQVPYVRYYRGGDLVGESNFVSQEGFLAFFRD